MYSLVEKTDYRKDIDGLRALAVLVVFVFHCGFLPAGYLGVDIFFVISGYLITKIIYLKSLENKFSILDFYLRRIRRIIPLVSFFGLFSLVVGLFVMLPDDLENLAQSIVATNFFGNNVLQYITTGNYWDIVNEFKPLMHTWSLGIEEQYYFLYPFVFLILRRKLLKFVLPLLIGLTLISLLNYYIYAESAANFYLLPSRFYELSIGGIGAVVFRNKLVLTKLRPLYIAVLLLLCIIEIPIIPTILQIPLVVVFTLLLLITAAPENSWSEMLLENKVCVGLGKISFSIYMWHQVILAFSRYFVLERITITAMLGFLVLTLLLSVLTYYFIEQPFRNKKVLSTRKVLSILSLLIAITTAGSMYIYYKAGVIKDIPELGITKNNVSRGMHALYNDRVAKLEKRFNRPELLKILVIGDSFGRDWANVLMESKYHGKIDLVYLDINQTSVIAIQEQSGIADIIFWSELEADVLDDFKLTTESAAKIWSVGTKNFGVNNGIFYNYNGEDYCAQRAQMEGGYLERNKYLLASWPDRYIDLIGLIIDEKNRVPVFTDECKFISQDTRHLTQAGARYFAKLIEDRADFILNKKAILSLD